MATAAAWGSRRTIAIALIVLLGLAVFLNYVDRGAIGIAAPLLTTDLRLDPAQFGWVLSAFYWAYALVQLFVGRLIDRYSVYRLMSLGLFLWAVATALIGFAQGFLSLLVLRVLLGMGETIAFPGGSKIIARHVPDERRGLANAAMALGIALGPVAGTLAGGFILAAYGWQAIFFLFGAVTLLWLVPWEMTIRAVEDPELTEPALDVPMSAIIGRWSLWSMSIAHVASNYVFYFLLGWLPLFLTKSRGLPIREMTLIATAGFAVQAVSALASGWASDWWVKRGRSEDRVRRTMMIAGQLLAALAVLGLIVAQTPAELTLVLCVAGLASGALSLNTYAVAQMFSGPRAAGTWVGIQNAIGNLSGIFGLPLTGYIVKYAGYNAACAVTAAIAAAGAIWWIVGVPKIRRIELD